MTKRSMILFPHFPNMDVIRRIREKHDPLAPCIAPHITVVFPFESNLTTEELKRHMGEALQGVKQFPVGLAGFAGETEPFQ